MQTDYILKKALSTASEYGRDPFFAAKQVGASVNFKDLGSLKGAYFGKMKTPAIVINEALDERMQKTVCAHELGHHMLHDKSTLSCDASAFDKTTAGILEREANLYAAAFLIDSKRMMAHLKDGLSISETASLMEADINMITLLLSTLELTDAPDSGFLK